VGFLGLRQLVPLPSSWWDYGSAVYSPSGSQGKALTAVDFNAFQTSLNNEHVGKQQLLQRVSIALAMQSAVLAMIDSV